MDQITKTNHEQKLLVITKSFLQELESDRPPRRITLNASFEKDLGIGSLERVELLHRIEKVFNFYLGDQVIAQISSLQDVIPYIVDLQSSNQGLVKGKVGVVHETQIDTSKFQTLIDALKTFSELEPMRPHIYLLDDEGNEKIIRYGQLLESSIKVAKNFVLKGLKPGETVAIMLPTCENFFYCFFGILLAGGVPVPIYPPFRIDQVEEYAKREAKILNNAGIRFLITFQQAKGISKLLKVFIGSLKEIITAEELLVDLDQSIDLPVSYNPDDAALIQYTSGSTSDPKGVLLTHANLIANLRAIGKAINITSSDRVVSWLPLYHDMGLIGTWLGSLYFGTPATILSPIFFLNRPERWFWALHYYRGTISAAPNFAYELCVRKISDEMIEGLDLSSWRLAFNGAEAIYPKTLDRFTKRFAAYGLKPETMFPVYGLAECSVALAFPQLGRVPRVDYIDREMFTKDKLAVPVVNKDKTNYLEFVSCGRPLEDHFLRVVDDADEELPERVIGNLQFKGPSSMQGYYANPDATQAAYHQGWWSTGDLGYLADGEIFITGRKKDVIIKAGRNLHAAELEDIAAQVSGVRKGCVAAFGVHDPQSGSEKVIVVAETKETNSEKKENIRSEIIEKIARGVGLPPDQVVLVSTRSIPKTSSGKLRRAACKERYLQGTLGQKELPAWMQLSKLFVINLGKNTARFFANIGRFFYTIYFSIIFIVMVFPLWLGLIFLPRKFTPGFARATAKNILRITGYKIVLNNPEKLNHQSTIFVSNHASYMDSLLLLGALPKGVAFVAKQELLKVPVLKTFIKKLGHLTVDRLDFSQSLADTKKIHDHLTAGGSILIFPEGTFTNAPGLRPFKLGAFKLAAETSRAICPVAIQGTRSVLRDEYWLLKPGTLTITASDLIWAKDRDWSEIVRLRTLARIEIAKHCGEPTTDFING